MKSLKNRKRTILNKKKAALSTGNPGKIHVFFIKEPRESKW
jgi:hypothetical protein